MENKSIEEIVKNIMNQFTERDKITLEGGESSKYTILEIFDEFEKQVYSYIENGGLWDGG